MHYILFYDYVPDVAERRAPLRDQHLALLRGLHEQGRVVMAGAWADPLDGAAIVFNAPGRDVVEAFVKSDPYVAGGLVIAWRIREWNVAIGGP